MFGASRNMDNLISLSNFILVFLTDMKIMRLISHRVYSSKHVTNIVGHSVHRLHATLLNLKQRVIGSVININYEMFIVGCLH